MPSKVWQVVERQHLSVDGIVAIVFFMSVLEWLAWLGVDSCVLSVAIACDFSNTFERALKQQVQWLLGLLALGFVKKPVGWVLGFATWAALRFAPRNQALLMYRKRRTWTPCH